jgi:type IV secretion system protein VirB6
MGAPVDFHFYERIFTTLDASLLNYVTNTATSIIGAIRPVAITLLAIYVCLWGWAMLRGMISEPVVDGAFRVARVTIILAVALEIGRYNEYVGDFLMNSPTAIANVVAGAPGTPHANFLDRLMSDIYMVGEAFWQKGAAAGVMVPDLGLMLVAILIWVAGVAATGYGAFLLCLAKLCLAVIVAVGPIFVLLTLFDATKRFFDVWLGQALTFVFTVMLTAAVIKLILTIIQQYLMTSASIIADPSINQAIPLVVICLISALVLMQVQNIAGALGGGVAVGTMGAVGWAYGKTTGAMAAMRPTRLASAAKGVKRDLRVVGNAASSVANGIKAAASPPMAVYRKITGANKAKA